MSNSYRIFFRASFIVFLAITLILALLPEKNLSNPIFHIGFRNDKLNHAGAFAVLSMIGILGWNKHSLRLIAFLLLVGALIEILQGLPLIGKDCDFSDWIADLLGTTLGAGASLCLLRYRVHTNH